MSRGKTEGPATAWVEGQRKEHLIRMGRLPGNIAGSPKKAILQTFRIYDQHSGFIS